MILQTTDTYDSMSVLSAATGAAMLAASAGFTIISCVIIMISVGIYFDTAPPRD